VFFDAEPKWWKLAFHLKSTSEMVTHSTLRDTNEMDKEIQIFIESEIAWKIHLTYLLEIKLKTLR
jgi:hypothetical protein